MSFRPTTLERAFALAKTGEYSGVSEIKAQLQAEGYALGQLEGPSLLRQLRELCAAAQAGRADQGDAPIVPPPTPSSRP